MKRNRNGIRFLISLFNWKEILVTCALVLLCTLAPIALLYYTREIVDMRGDTPTLYGLICVAALLTVLLVLFQQFQKYAMTRYQQSMKLRAEHRLAEKLAGIRLDEYEKTETYDAIMEVWTHFGSIMQICVYVMNIVIAVVQIVGITLFLCGVSPILGLGIIVGYLPSVLLTLKFGFEKYFTEVQQLKDYRRNWYLSKLAFERQSNQEMRYFGLYPYIAEKQEKLNLRLNTKMYQVARKHFLRQIPTFTIAAIVYTGSLLYCINQVDRIGYGIIAILFQAIAQIRQAIFSCGANGEGLVQKYRSVLNGILVLNNAEDEPERGAEFEFRDLRIDDLCYRYPGMPKDAVHRVSLSIRAGEKIVIAGENGSGKTTLLNLILRFYTPTTGGISINGMDDERARVAFRSQCGVLLQNYVRFDLSLYDNIDMGRQMGEEAVNAALALVGLGEWGREVGLDTKLGGVAEGSRDASGGQWQRIAIARALLGNKKVLILDEPAASLDPESENNLYDLLTTLPSDMTVIYTSHRLGMTRKMNRILVMHDGEIVEDGTHAKLLNRHGFYEEMYAAQASVYLV